MMIRLFITLIFSITCLVEAMCQTPPQISVAKSLGNNGQISVSDIKRDLTGNMVITGKFSGTSVDFDPSAATRNISAGSSNQAVFLAKYDPSGNYLWAFSLPNTNYADRSNYPDEGKRIAIDNLGNIYLTGHIAGNSETPIDFDPSNSSIQNKIPFSSYRSYDVFLAKYSSAGEYLWAFFLGSSYDDYASDLELDAAGNVYITGYWYGSSADFDPGSGSALLTSNAMDVFLAKYTSAGVYAGAKSIGGANNDYGTGLDIDGSGNIYLTGYYSVSTDLDPSPSASASFSSQGSEDLFIAKYDASLNHVWSKSIGGTSIQRSYNLDLDGNGNILISGIYYASFDMDPSPANIFNLSFAGISDIFIAKFSTTGNFIWALGIGGTSQDEVFSMSQDPDGNVYVAGSFTGAVDFDPGTETTYMTSDGGTYSDGFFAKYFASGGLACAYNIGGNTVDRICGIDATVPGNIVLAGTINNATADLDLGSGTYNLTTSGTASYFASYSTFSNVQWNGTVSTDWNTAANWTPANIPSSESLVTLPSGLTNYPALSGNTSVQSLTVSEGTFSLGSFALTVAGNLTNNSIINGSGKVRLGGISAQTISGTGSLSNLEIANAAGVTITSGAGNMQTITGKLTPTSGTLTTNGNLTLRSNASGTARVGEGSSSGGYISGDVVTQRYLSKLTGSGRNGRAWRLVTIPVTGTGTLRDVFMAGQSGADLTVSGNRSAQPADLGTVVIGHNQPDAAAANGAGYDWIGVANQLSSLRYYQQNATSGSFASSQVPTLSTTYTDANQGYMLFARGDRQQTYNGTGNASATVLQATGALKQGTINVTIPALASAGFVLVGNPYMALLDLEKVIVDNAGVIDNTVYIWDANIDGNSFKQGGYRAVTRTGVNTWTASGAGVNPQYIESGSAFFVKPTVSGGTLSIKEAHKVDGTPGIAPHGGMADGPSRLFINLEVTDTANRRLVDGAVTFFDTNYKDGLGDAVDIEPMTNLTAGSITLRQSGKRLSMEGRPWPADSAARIIPVDMRNLGDDAYVLRMLPTNMRKEGFTAWLKDRQLNKETAINTDGETLYPFRRTGDVGIDSSRFEIVYRLSKPTGTGTLTPDDAAGEIGPRLWPNPAKADNVKLSLGSLAPGRYEVQVLDMMGRSVMTRSIEHLSSSGAHQILRGQKLAPGQYLIRISSNDRPLHTFEFIHH